MTRESSIIFYCKTKLKDRGYTENIDSIPNQATANILVVPPSAESVEDWKRTFSKYELN